MEGNNFSGEIASDRDTWMKMEEHLLKELKKNPKNRKKIDEYNRKSARLLYDRAIQLIEEIEDRDSDLENEEIREKVEEITLIFGAIVDAQREHERERYWDPQEDETAEREKNDYYKMIERIKNIPKEILERIVRENGTKKIQEIKEFLILMSSASSKVPQTKSKDRIAEFQSQENEGKDPEDTHKGFRGSIRPTQTANIGREGREEESRERER